MCLIIMSEDNSNNNTPIDLSMPKPSSSSAEQPQISTRMTINSSPPSPPPPESTRKYQLIQKQLRLLLHAAGCHRQPICSVQHCSTMKNVLHHLRTCSDNLKEEVEVDSNKPSALELGVVNNSSNRCRVPYCISSKQILGHWKSCIKSSNRKQCLVCGNNAKMGLGLGLKRKSTTPPHTSGSEDFESKKFKLWSGSLEWTQQQKPPGSKNILLQAEIFSNDNNTSNWPSSSKLTMKLIPSHLTSKFGSNYFSSNSSEVEKVLVKLDDDDFSTNTNNQNYKEFMELHKLLKSTKYVGYVTIHFSGSGTGPNKLLILQYDHSDSAQLDQQNNNYLIGYIPKNQKYFIEKLREIVKEEIVCKLKREKEEVEKEAGMSSKVNK